ncbi:MAG: DegT/DnrJ/EryC1/StrS family aminotransferase [Microscillaceae bacterium]|jgi:dTDP-4-amino-4,6-dideoxygalactose transaminase|nr:DegT/DnrJ/EryC1/StrS family aminotransferase [Microscillaceae bacterium]
MIPFFNLTRQLADIQPLINEAIEKALSTGIYTGAEVVRDFEADFAQFCQSKYAIAVNNGTSALHLALSVLGIGKGDEVIVPANTFISTAWAVSYTGATPIFVDCEADTWEISPTDLQTKITPRTKAVIGVHLYGQVFDYEQVSQICQANQLYLLEDAAQAHGATYEGKKVGSLGDLAAFSFYPTKNLGTYGEGGAITTQNENYFQKIKKLRNLGASEKYFFDEIGFNYRLGAVEAAVLRVKLQFLAQWNQRRQQIAQFYQQNIQNPLVKMQKTNPQATSVYHLFVITTPNRDKFRDFLGQHNIQTALHYPCPCHLQAAYKFLAYRPGDLPNAEYLAAHCVSLPMFAELTNSEVEKIVEVINKFLNF